MSRNKIQLALLASTSLLLALIIVYVANHMRAPSSDQHTEGLRAAGIIALPKPRDIPPLNFQTSNDKSVVTTELKDKWYLIYFGYTYCPDICPTSLAEMRQIHRLLTPQAQQQVEFIMVSVDPNRDTPQQLRAYLDFFHPDFKGFTGEMADVQKFSNALGIPFIPGDISQPGYTVDHSGNLAIISPAGQHFGFVQAPFKIEQVAKQFNLFVQQAK